MDRAIAVRCLELAEDALEQGSLRTLDITGGAPELSPQFRSGSWDLRPRQPPLHDVRAQPAVQGSLQLQSLAAELL